MKIHVRSRELFREELSLHKLVNKGCSHMADVRLTLILANLIHQNVRAQVVVKKEPRHAAESVTSGGVTRVLNVRYHLNKQLQLMNNHHQLQLTLI